MGKLFYQKKKFVNDYSESKDGIKDLGNLEKYIDENIDKSDIFELASYVFLETIRIHPFLNGNGRATRLFVEQLLLNKGYRLEQWPEETLYRKIITPEDLTELIKKNCVKTD